ncbi:flagellin [Halomonas llamarensis]|uniref:Flagellin n=1 Tax=Halomonas llamarensis TaxID=2945104 RepID=A0ABT0SLC3_9GAMM|nr:flagellin [Halomonas llamarensis]MCL7928592.1 flagellin FliC [Halomonas llamarensis]
MSVINTNITSMIGQNNLSKSQNDLQTSMERLSSGLRINSAKDDAAGQAIANRFTSQITGLGQAQRNANDGISIAQTAEGGLNQVNDNLQRVRELTVQASNGTNSQSDLESIQNEINQRMSEIDRISKETDFNGTKVLAENGDLSIQVGADDGQTISVGLQQITSQTLGLDGFNVDGSGETQNRGATVTDLIAAGGATNGGDNTYRVTTTFDSASLEQILGEIENGDTVTTAVGSATDETAYTFDAASGDFTYTDTVAAADVDDLAAANTPASGTASGTYEFTSGSVANFEVSSTGNITIGGEAAYLSASNELTTNTTAGGGTQATLEDVLNAGTDADAAVTIGGTTYSGDGTDLTFTNTASQGDVLAAADGTNTNVDMSSGLTSATIAFDNAGDTTDAFVDFNDEVTTQQTFVTDYSVNPETGEVTVLANYENDGTTEYDGQYALDVGETANVSAEGRLTTDETSAGERTEDPLAALDSALAQVDGLRSDLGAIQNRFESAITNLQTNETNLSAARSRIEDADYASEVANMTRAQILQQAGTSVLAQANQIPQNVLSLLG